MRFTYRIILLALKALRRNILRSALTTLGIVIGIAAVIAMMEIGQGSSSALQRTIQSMGADNLLVQPGTASSGGVSFGNGSIMKYIANLLVTIHNVSAAEAMVLGMKAGLDPRMIVDLITAGAGNSRVFELRAPMMAKGRYDDVTMKISVWDKDMQVISDFARKIRVPTPIFNATKGIYVKAMKSGFGNRDTAAVCAVLEKMAKVKRRKRAA